MHHLLAIQTGHELHTTCLEYQLRWQEQLSSWLKTDPAEDEHERIATCTETGRELAASLYVLYHSHRRFATETVGIGIDT